MIFKFIREDKKNLETIMEVIGITRTSLDTKERRHNGQFNQDGEAVYEEVDKFGQTTIYSYSGIFCTLDLEDSKHNALAQKFNGSNGLIATIKVDKDGKITIS